MKLSKKDDDDFVPNDLVWKKYHENNDKDPNSLLDCDIFWSPSLKKYYYRYDL